MQLSRKEILTLLESHSEKLSDLLGKRDVTKDILAAHLARMTELVKLLPDPTPQDNSVSF